MCDENKICVGWNFKPTNREYYMYLIETYLKEGKSN